jgi:hypothetical protein
VRGFLGARSQFDFGDEDVACVHCGGSGWTIWNTRKLPEDAPVTLFIACADCNDDMGKPYPAPWPVCEGCEQSLNFCQCIGTSFPFTLPEFTN